MWTTLALFAGAYLAGAIPTGYLAGKIAKGVDVRELGSRSTGATNVLRTVGKGPALVVLIVDIAKGYLPVWLSIYLESNFPGALIALPWHVIPPAVALLCLVGHSRSIFLGFQGGKSAATGLGTLLALNPIVALEIFGLWLAVVAGTKIVSLASIIAVGLAPALMAFAHGPASYIVYCALAAIFVIWRHKTNIVRLMQGTEQRLGEKPKTFS